MSDPSKEEKIIEQLRIILEESSTEDRDMSNFGHSTTVEQLGLDSLTILDLLYDIEEATGIQIEAKEIIEFRTIGQITDLVIQKGG